MTDFPISALPAMTEILGTESLVGVQTSTKRLPISVLVNYLGSATAGVASFNGRTGIVTQTSLDVTTALGYVPTSVIGLTGALSAASFKTGLSLTKSDVGLGSVDNTSDTAKPVSTAQQTALDLKADLSLRASSSVFGLAKVDGTTITATGGVLSAVGGGSGVSTFNTRSGAVTLLDTDVTGALGYTPTSVTGLTGTQSVAAFKTGLTLVKGDIGLGNVDNTSDANKPISTATQTALNATQPLDATLTALAGVTTAADKVIYATGVDTFTTADFGSVARTLVAQTSQGAMRTTGLGMSANGSSLVAAADYAAMKVLLSLSKSDVGLGNVDNTADTAKPVSTAQQTALDLKADLSLRGSDSVFGLVQVDNTTITASGGVISAVGGGGGPSAANPTATAGATAINGSAGTFMRSDAAPAVAQGSSSVKGIVQVDGTTITASSGVISAAGFLAIASNLSDLANAATARTNLGVAIGSNVQAYSANLTTWAGVVPGTGIAAALAIAVGSAGAPVLFNGAGGTPSSLTLTNATGLPVGSVTGLAANMATFLATPTSANLRAAVTDESGSGALLFASGAIGTPTSGTLTNCTGLPIGGTTGWGTGVATALAIAVGSAGGPVVNGGALGTPSGGALTNCTADGTNAVGYRNIPLNSKTGSYTLLATDVGKAVPNTTGGWTANNSVHAAGDTIVLVNNSASSQTITQGSGVTMRLAGTTTTGSRTLAARGMATLFFLSASEVYVSGPGVT